MTKQEEKELRLLRVTEINRCMVYHFEFGNSSINYIEADGAFTNFACVSTEKHFNILVKRIQDAKGRIYAKFRMKNGDYIYCPTV